MKTHPILRADGSLCAFEISSAWIIFRPLYGILRSVPGVESVKRIWFKGDRISFTFDGVPYVVSELYGDNSRFWVGPVLPESPVNIEPLHDAFKRYTRLDIFGFAL